MPTTAYTTRPLKGELLVSSGDGVVKIAAVVFAKLIVVTRVDETGHDSALAMLSLEAVGGVDKAMTTLWHSSDGGSLQPADTVSLQLPLRIKKRLPKTKTQPPATSSVSLFASTPRGVLEIRDIVITAIKVDSMIGLPL